MLGSGFEFWFPQSRVVCALWQVCKLRELPIFTFVNKMDRPSLGPFELLDQIEREFGMKMAPVLWPIGDGEQFKVRTMRRHCRLL